MKQSNVNLKKETIGLCKIHIHLPDFARAVRFAGTTADGVPPDSISDGAFESSYESSPRLPSK